MCSSLSMSQIIAECTTPSHSAVTSVICYFLMKTINFIQQVSERFFSYFIYFMCFSYNFFFYIEDIFQSFWVFHLQKRMRQLSKATSFRSKEGRELDDVGG